MNTEQQALLIQKIKDGWKILGKRKPNIEPIDHPEEDGKWAILVDNVWCIYEQDDDALALDESICVGYEYGQPDLATTDIGAYQHFYKLVEALLERSFALELESFLEAWNEDEMAKELVSG